jgi:hypothetical protein
VFGSPVIADGEPFWGFDRFAQLEAFLKNGKILMSTKKDNPAPAPAASPASRNAVAASSPAAGAGHGRTADALALQRLSPCAMRPTERDLVP